MKEDEVRVVKKCAKCGAETDVTVTVSHEGRQQGWCPSCIGTGEAQSAEHKAQSAEPNPDPDPDPDPSSELCALSPEQERSDHAT